MPSHGTIRLIGVYHADGGPRGELAYLLGKLRGTAHCALCDITHGVVAVTGKRAWKRLCADRPIEAVHLNERDERLRAFTDGRTPCVVAEVEGELRLLLGPTELEACGGDVAAFARALDVALAWEADSAPGG
jgi:hypothetical protein